MARSEPLAEFRASDAREVARWPTSVEEVRLWAGSAGGWPVDASVFWRKEREEGNRRQPVDYVWMYYPLG